MANWKKGRTFKEEMLERSIQIINNKDHLKLHEATARKHAKRYLIAKYGNVCSICELSDWFGVPIPLVCDHIDGDSLNNDIENFRLVCCNCDALLPTYKSKNKRGRLYDREYYQKKKKES